MNGTVSKTVVGSGPPRVRIPPFPPSSLDRQNKSVTNQGGIRFDVCKHTFEGITIKTMKSFSAKILKIGINPCVGVPEDVLNALFKQAEKTKGPIQVRGTINGKRFKQTLVRYRGAWRLYINGEMRQAAGIDVGDESRIMIEYDPVPRIESVPAKFVDALSKSKTAKVAFESLRPSRQKEILRYLNSMRTESSLERNIEKVIQHLVGEKPKGLHHLLEARD